MLEHWRMRPTTVASGASGAGESAAALLPHGRHSDPLTSAPALVVEGLLVLIAMLRLRQRVRNRRRHRYHPRHARLE